MSHIAYFFFHFFFCTKNTSTTLGNKTIRVFVSDEDGISSHLIAKENINALEN